MSNPMEPPRLRWSVRRPMLCSVTHRTHARPPPPARAHARTPACTHARTCAPLRALDGLLCVAGLGVGRGRVTGVSELRVSAQHVSALV